jgi:hypothetical protein
VLDAHLVFDAALKSFVTFVVRDFECFSSVFSVSSVVKKEICGVMGITDPRYIPA